MVELYCICNFNVVNLKAKQVETLFGELEYLEPLLKALDVDVAYKGSNDA